VRHREAFLHFGLRYSKSREDVLDIFQDAVVALHQGFVTEQTELTQGSVKTYLFAIGKHKLFARLREKQKMHLAPENDEEMDWQTDFGEQTLTNEQQLLATHFAKLGESCRHILKLFYYRGLSVKEIVELTHYKDENTVKSQKSRCLKSLTERIHKHE